MPSNALKPAFYKFYLVVRFLKTLSHMSRSLVISWYCISYKFLQYISSVIRQKAESQNGCFKKTKQVKFSKKATIRHVCFFGKLGVLCFLETLVLRFDLLPYYRLDHIRILALFLFFEQLVNSNRWWSNVIIGSRAWI